MANPDGRASMDGQNRTRRQVLAAAGTTGLVGLAGCGGGGDGGGSGESATTTQQPTTDYANYPVSGDEVRIGVSVPQTGSFSQEGEQLQAGYELAAANLNAGNGVVGTSAFESLDRGIRGKDVEVVTADTGSTGEGARDAAASLVGDGAVLLAGGASSDEAVAHQQFAADRKIVNMVGFAPANSIGGEDCTRYGFRELFNGRMIAKALRPVLEERFGPTTRFAQVRPRSRDGEDLARSIEAEMTGESNWTSLGTVATRMGTQEFRGPIREAIEDTPQVLVLDYYGLDAAYALRQAHEVMAQNLAVVVPLLNRPMARNASGSIEDVIGTVAWDPGIDQPLSETFAQAWADSPQGTDRNLQHPSGLAHLAYFQVLQYAAAVERAGTFEPPAVVDELEGHTYDTGMGQEELRACDHQAMRPVPVVRGLPEREQGDSRFFEVLEVASESVGYGCSEAPASRCTLDG